MTSSLVAVLGHGPVKSDEPVLAADDLGLTRGDGCFETTRVVTTADGKHRIDHLDAHFARMDASLAALDLPPVDRAAWSALIDELLELRTGSGEALLKLMISRGRESSADPAGPASITGIATLTPISATSLTQRENGVAVISLPRGTASDAYAAAPWLLGGVKTLSYAVNVAAMRVAHQRGVDDVVFTSTDGFVLEAPTSTVVWRTPRGLFTTPTGGTGVLASITQRALFEAAEGAGIETGYELTTVEELQHADGVWLTSSGRGLARIITLDGMQLPSPDPAVADQLRQLSGF